MPDVPPDLRPDHLRIVRAILRRHVPEREVWAFGSRVTWTAKEYSDLDLAVIGEQPLPLSVSAALADDFADSDLPFKVDVVDWATTSESFRGIISKMAVVVQKDEERLEEGVAGRSQEVTVARILGTLDDKIELNRRQNTTLEAMARAIFKSWFVDFDPVRAKAAGCQPFGMEAATAALFPDAFEGSELGEIPQGWNVKPVADVIEINPPCLLRKGVNAPYLDMANVSTNSACVDEVIVREFSSGTKFKNGDTLLTRITPCLENGKTAFVDFLLEGQVGWGSTEFIVLRPKPPLPPEYGYFLARDDGFRSFAIANMSGTSGRQCVPVDCFGSYLLAVPSPEIAKAFGRIASRIMKKIMANNRESRILAAERDTLLPKLMSGELRVPRELAAGAVEGTG